MRFQITAACDCQIGRVRSNNEDNFCFDGKCLDVCNEGLVQPLVMQKAEKKGAVFAVFDGMGGENYGEAAAFAAAKTMCAPVSVLLQRLMPAEAGWLRLVDRLNTAVVRAAGKLHTERMGTTMAALCCAADRVSVCNVGDSRVYRFRENALNQLSRDHVEKGASGTRRKAPLTQHLGIDPQDMRLEPHIETWPSAQGDRYLLCSDGLTDMLTDEEISDIMGKNGDAAACAASLMQAALDHGGRDNITVIVCAIT